MTSGNVVLNEAHWNEGFSLKPENSDFVNLGKSDNYPQQS